MLAANSQAAEIDFLTGQVSGSTGGGAPKAGTNILFYLDGSGSIDSSWDSWLKKDPAIATTDPDVQAYLAKRDDFLSTLRHKDIIPSALFFEWNDTRCAVGTGFGSYGEDDRFGECAERYRSWSIQKSTILRDALRDTFPDLLGMNVGILRSGLNNGGMDEATGNPRTSFDATIADQNHGAFVIQAFRPLDSVVDAQTLATDLVTNYSVDGERQNHIRDRPPHKSPLAEALLESYWYLTSQKSLWDKSQATSWPDRHLGYMDNNAFEGAVVNADYAGPNLSNGCSVSHVVMITDGEPTWDWAGNDYIQNLTGAPAPTQAATYSEVDRTPAQTLLDELAGYLANNDLDPASPGKQTIVTHFLSTWSDPELLKILDAAVLESGGQHLALQNIKDMPQALRDLTQSLNSGPLNFNIFQTALVQSENLEFKKQDIAFVIESKFSNGLWASTLKRFNTDKMGVLSGQNAERLVDAQTNVVNKDTLDVWSTAGEAGLGGAANKISALGLNRYTLLQNQGQGRFANQTNALSSANENTIKTLINTDALSDVQVQTTYNWLLGADINDLDGDGNVAELRQAFGDQINQKPETVFSGADDMTVYFGDNAGFLNAIDGKTGDHLYSFMPPEFLADATELAGTATSGSKLYGIDGALKNFELIDPTTKAKVQYLAFSFGKGGSGVYILDVTDRDQPSVVFRTSAKNTGYDNLGEAWATPELTYMNTPNGIKPVAIFGAGYSEDGAKGDSVYVVDLSNGSKLWEISDTFNTVLAQHKYPIVNKMTLLDSNEDGVTDTFFYNDISGNIFRCDATPAGLTTPVQCGQLASAQANNGNLKFFSPLDVALIKPDGNTLQLAFTQSSGDRLNPNSSTENDRLMVALFDNPFTVPTGLYNGTVEPLNGQELPKLQTASSSTTGVNFKNGWSFSFPNAGEKSFGKTLIFNNQIYLTTYQAGVSPTTSTNTIAGPSTTTTTSTSTSTPSSTTTTTGDSAADPVAAPTTAGRRSDSVAAPTRGNGRRAPIITRPTEPSPPSTITDTTISGGSTTTSTSTSSSSGSTTTTVPSTVADCGTTETQGIARIYGFNLLNPTSGVQGKNLGEDLWEGPIRNLPDTPSVVRGGTEEKPVAFINLGIDNTNIQVEYEPLQRQYWYEKSYK